MALVVVIKLPPTCNIFDIENDYRGRATITPYGSRGFMNTSLFSCRHFVIRAVTALAALSLLAACGGDEDTKSAQTQVAARVNGEEITISQVNFALTRMAIADEAQARQASRNVLNALIDQQLLLQKASEQELDRDPNVMQAAEQAKQQVLAQAYLERAAASIPTPSKDEVSKFYREHPELFKDRRLYRFQELTAAGIKPEMLKTVQTKLSDAKSLNDAANWLKTQNIAFNAGSSVKPAEQLPTHILAQAYKMKPGQLIVTPVENNVLAIQLLATQSMPVTETAATPIIEGYLKNQQRVELTQKEVKNLRADAKIDYLGEFAKDAAATPAASKSADAATDKKRADDSLEKGMAGLK